MTTDSISGEAELRRDIATDRLIDARQSLIRAMSVLDAADTRRTQAMAANAVTIIDDAITELGR